jgi:SAM-dependent methyltransferase
MESTIEYYNKNAQEFIKSTVNIDMSQLYEIFVRNIPRGGKILDLGCGSGRDSKYFIESGYHVTAIDGSAEMCKRASKYLGIPVLNMKIEDLSINEKFDGIWACASLLHVKKAEMNSVVSNLLNLLKPQGTMYASWKYGNCERIEDNKFYSDYDEEQICDLAALEGVDTKIWVSCDQTRNNIKWVNLVVTKSDEEI